MNNWPVKLVAVFNLLLGLLIAVTSIMMLTGEEKGTSKTSDEVWIGIGCALLIVGIGILTRQGWARILGITVALVFAFIAAVFVVKNGTDFQGGNSQLKLMLVISMGIAQLFAIAVLALGWKKG